MFHEIISSMSVVMCYDVVVRHVLDAASDRNLNRLFSIGRFIVKVVFLFQNELICDIKGNVV